eukprot:2904760-Prymnesium_polylepis.1
MIDGALVARISQQPALRRGGRRDDLARAVTLRHRVAHIVIDRLAEHVEAVPREPLLLRRLLGVLLDLADLVVVGAQLRERALAPDILRAVDGPQLELHPLRLEAVDKKPRRDVVKVRAIGRRAMQRADLLDALRGAAAAATRGLSRLEALHLRDDEQDNALALADAAHPERGLRVIAEDEVGAESEHRARRRALRD